MFRVFSKVVTETGRAGLTGGVSVSGGSFITGCRGYSGQHRSFPRDRKTVSKALPRGEAGFGTHSPKLVDSTLVEEGLVRGADVFWKDSAALKLRRRARIAWEEGGPKRVLVVKKPEAKEATAALRSIVDWLRERGLEPFVERSVHRSECKDIAPFDPGEDVDFCITLGGDGTVLHLASLFVKDVPLPPVLSFAMGTLGFLTPFDFKDYDEQLSRVLAPDQTVGCTLRSRKRCEVYTSEGKLLGVHHVLNECIIDRGHSASTLTLEIFVDGQYITTVTADGVIIATPSGSTAYSMTAGGPMVAPSVPCTLITPVAPLSLSFRPLVLPESSDVIMHVAEHSKSRARACFDGKQQARLLKGSAVHLTASLYPLPMINMGRLDSDWYEGITQKLKWNASIVEPPSRPKGVPNGLSNGHGVHTT
ncbi:hypothetical protein BSKO_12816 [Bryopsis sp. KO-2023]|nr:hypothetical protein BSKO_12816 [Bryopsis sp. KO-2023]